LSIERDTSRSPASVGDHRGIADPDALQRLVAVGGADVDVEAVELDRLLSLIVLQQMHRLATDDADHRPVLRLDLDPLSDQDLGVPASDWREVGEALVVDVGDREPDLVDVAHDGDQGPRVGASDAGDR
jgi:hypothetical protein